MGARSSSDKAGRSGSGTNLVRSSSTSSMMKFMRRSFSNLFPSKLSGRSYQSLDDAILGCIWVVVDLTKPTQEQRAFLQQWLELVFKPNYSPQAGSAGLAVSTDLASSLELWVRMDSQLAGEVAQEFMGVCGEGAMLQHMEMVTTQLQCSNTIMWCRLKRMGTSSASLDAGFEACTAVPWIVADLLMPPTSDLDLVKEHARQERLAPCSYGCSLIPTEPERYLQFDIQQAMCTTKNTLYTCLFFFKALGFAKPDDKIVKALTHLSVPHMALRCSMGPGGLTRMAMGFMDPHQPEARRVADIVDFPFSDEVAGLPSTLGTPLKCIHFTAEDRGYTLTVGFSL